MYEKIKEKFEAIVFENNLGNLKVLVKAKTLSAEEAIGNPERDDFPLLKGRERLMQAEVQGSAGQAFTDMYGDFEGTLDGVIRMELSNNFRRAVFIATLNAVMRHLGLIEGTVHCRDEGPEACTRDLIEFIKEGYRTPKIALFGFQPSFADRISRSFEMKLLDLDPENIGCEKFGVTILDGDKEAKNAIEWCDLALLTVTSLVNGTTEQNLVVAELAKKPVVF